jgi:hypothetical protein
MRDGFSIVMKGSEIKSHVELFAEKFEAEAKKLEAKITDCRKEGRRPASPYQPFGVPSSGARPLRVVGSASEGLPPEALSGDFTHHTHPDARRHGTSEDNLTGSGECPFHPVDHQVEYLESIRKSYLDAADRHREFASFIELDENFRLTREDISFLGLLRGSQLLAGAG